MQGEKSFYDRRGFLRKAAGSAVGVSVIPSGLAFGSVANSKLNLAVTGCGHRGEFVGTLFEKNTSTKVVAIHDYFTDRVENLGDKLNVAKGRRHIGLEGYRELFSDDVDAVAVMSPPWFHPQQCVEVLESNKHLYLTKPMAVDVPGCNQIVEAAEKAKGELSILVDFQTRNHPLFQEAAKRVLSGDIGAPVLGQVYYQAGRLRVKATGNSPMARLRNWVFDIALSGDIIVEQNIHVIDVANWYLNGHPVKAYGTGGRKARTDVGDCWDHYVVTFWYDNDVIVDFSSGQYLKGFDDLCIRIFGSVGTVDSHYGGPVVITGDKEWPGGSTEGIYSDGTINNIKDFHASVINGNPLYDTLEESARSNLSAILGRMAAKQNRVVTWEEMIRSEDTMESNLSLPSGAHDWRP
jgi:predicted dehydrogenase